MESQIQITGLHDLKLTPAITEHVHKRLAILERHFDHITDIHVYISTDKKGFEIAKANIHMAGGGHVVAEETSKDMYESIDMLAKNLDQQVKKHKEKLQKRTDKNSNHLREE